MIRQAHTFDAAAWFASWSDAGGIVAMIGDRLWIGRTPSLDREATRRLNSLRGAALHPDAGRAVAGLLRGNRMEVEA